MWYCEDNYPTEYICHSYALQIEQNPYVKGDEPLFKVSTRQKSAKFNQNNKQTKIWLTATNNDHSISDFWLQTGKYRSI